MVTKPEAEKEYEDLLKQYIEVFNRAVEENQNKFPYKEMWHAAFHVEKNGNDINYVVYDVRPKASFTLRFNEGKLKLIDKNKKQPKDFCSLSYDYLKSVADNADEYIKNPEKLNWQWLNK